MNYLDIFSMSMVEEAPNIIIKLDSVLELEVCNEVKQDILKNPPTSTTLRSTGYYMTNILQNIYCSLSLCLSLIYTHMRSDPKRTGIYLKISTCLNFSHL